MSSALRFPAPRLALLLAAFLLLPAFAQARDGREPREKDTHPRFKPAQVQLAASVEPASAKPGDTVRYTVTAKLQPKWHIYPLTTVQPEVGPRQTEIDLFDTADLVPDGDWKPSKLPERAKEPAFPELEFVEFYAEEVSWSINLKIPPDAQPGPRAIRSQAYYQICDDQSCSRPGRWTLPDAQLVVASADAPADAPAPASAPASAPVAAKPARPDDNPRFKPDEVRLELAVEPASAKPGDTVSLTVAATLQPGWHIYGLEPVDFPGPHTEFDLYDAGGLEIAGEWTSDPAPEPKPDPLFPDIPALVQYDDRVVWTLPLRVPDDAVNGPREIGLQAYYQICDAMRCSRPGRWTLTPVKFTVEGGAEAPPAAPAPVNVAAASAPAPAAAPPAAAAPAPAADLRPTPAPGYETAVPATAEPRGGPASAPAARNNAERAIDQGLWAFLLLCVGGGLLALAMPCVWPMIPITVSFFLKQSESKPAGAFGLAFVYGAAIVAIFTLFGLVCAALFDAASLNNLANNPFLNLFVAAMFILFGLSLLGLFEIRLPNFLLNLSARGESVGGLVGVMFMALTLTITSFTCTLPVVGALLVLAAKGDFLYPVLGMVVFASVLAAPFLFLALSPGLLKKLPRGGDWMNSFKVVGGLVEIGAAFKFINTAELMIHTPDEAWFDAQVLLAVWVTLAAVCGLHLLGIFRTDHDHGEGKVGPVRMLFGAFFLGSALYTAPALFGNPPQSRVYEFFVVGLLPPDAKDLVREPHYAPGASASPDSTDAPRERLATSSDPDLAQREQISFHGVPWTLSYEAGIERAKAENKLVLIDFTGVNCPNCRLMEMRVFPKPEIVELLKKFVTVQLYVDTVPIKTLSPDARKEIAARNTDLQEKLTNDVTMPFYAIVDPHTETAIDTIGGYREIPVFAKFLNDALQRQPAN